MFGLELPGKIRPRMHAVRMILGVTLLICGVRSAYGCSCPTTPSPVESLRRSRAVFEGTVIRKRAILGKVYEWYFPAEEVTFSVNRVWKGVTQREVTLLEEFSNCANRFSGGETYLVYASEHWPHPWYMSSIKCSRTRRIASAVNDLTELGASEITFPAAGAPTVKLSRRRLRSWWIAGIAQFANAPRQFRDNALRNPRWDLLGLGVAVVVLCAAAVAATVQRRRVAILLWILAASVAAVSILAQGYVALRHPYFQHLQLWQIESGA